MINVVDGEKSHPFSSETTAVLVSCLTGGLYDEEFWGLPGVGSMPPVLEYSFLDLGFGKYSRRIIVLKIIFVGEGETYLLCCSSLHLLQVWWALMQAYSSTFLNR